MKNRVLSIIVVLMLAAALVLPGASTASAATMGLTVVSDTSAIVMSTTGSGTAGQNAVPAWEPWEGTDQSYWDKNLSHTFPAEADWIWDSYRTYNVVTGDIVTFQKTFNVPGTPMGGTLYITTDNGYVAFLNGNLAGTAQLTTGWDITHLTQGYVDTNNWQSVEEWTINPLWLVPGNNVLTVVAVNEYMNTDDLDSNGNPQPLGNEHDNPAGLIFQLDVSYDAAGGTHTWGYWKTHSSHGPAPYDATWAILGENTTFFLSGASYYGVLGVNPAGGSSYYQLAHQYVAAKLDVLDGAWMRGDVQAAFNEATALLGSYTPAQIASYKKGTAAQKAIFNQFNQLAGILDAYNNGDMGTPHAP